MAPAGYGCRSAEYSREPGRFGLAEYLPARKQDSGPVSKPGILVVRSTEKLGQRTAFRVTVDKFILWYAADEAQTLLKYDDGFEIYTLIE